MTTRATHLHIDAAIDRLARTFQNANDWTTDTIMRQVDRMSDAALKIDSRASKQTELVAEIHHIVGDIKAQIADMRAESKQMETRIRADFLSEITRLRAEVHELKGGKDLLAETHPALRPRGESQVSVEQGGQLDLAASISANASARGSVSVPGPVAAFAMDKDKEKRDKKEKDKDKDKDKEPTTSFLRQVKSKTSLTGLNKRAEKDKEKASNESIPPVPPISVSPNTFLSLPSHALGPSWMHPSKIGPGHPSYIYHPSTYTHYTTHLQETQFQVPIMGTIDMGSKTQTQTKGLARYLSLFSVTHSLTSPIAHHLHTYLPIHHPIKQQTPNQSTDSNKRGGAPQNTSKADRNFHLRP